ncbi:WD40 repeat domain-containing serine/threonine protein kinase [Actinoallomurus acanthiterrae]
MLGDRYRLMTRLGQGGMGEVWSAADQDLDRRVAIKIVLAELDADPTSIARLRREARVAAGLQHPGITVVHDIGEHRIGDRAHPFFVMELLEGVDFKTLLTARSGALQIEMAVNAMAQVADALHHAHRKGVVHRDIKPANLMRLAAGGVKICDFGICQYADATGGLTATGKWLGTAAYMAPEQFDGKPIDHRADLYSLGCTLQALLTGQPPFTGPPRALMNQHLTAAPPRVSCLRPGVPAELDQLVAELLAKEPDQRPSDAAEIAASLRALLSHSPQRTDISPANPSTAMVTEVDANFRNYELNDSPTGHAPAKDTGSIDRHPTAKTERSDGRPRSGSPPLNPASPRPRMTRRRLLITAAAATATVGGGTAFALLWREQELDGVLPVPDDTTAVAVGQLNGRTIAVTGSGGGGSSQALNLRVWDLATGKQIDSPTEIVIAGVSHTVMAVIRSLTMAVLKAKPVVVCCTEDGLRVWDLVTRRPIGRTFNPGYAVAWMAIGELSGGPVVATGSISSDDSMMVWDMVDQQYVTVGVAGPNTPNGRRLQDAVIGQLNGKEILVGGADKTVRVWDFATQHQLGAPLRGHTGNVRAVAVGRLNGKIIAVTGGDDKTVRVWDLAAGKQIGASLTGHTGSVSAVAIGQLNGKTIAVTGGDDKTVRVWDLAAGKQIGDPLAGHTSEVNTVVAAQVSGKSIAVSHSGKKTVRVWDLAAGKPFAFTSK